MNAAVSSLATRHRVKPSTSPPLLLTDWSPTVCHQLVIRRPTLANRMRCEKAENPRLTGVSLAGGGI